MGAKSSPITVDAMFLVMAARPGAPKKIDEYVLLQTRLAPDQFPLIKQVQIATDSAKNGSARVACV